MSDTDRDEDVRSSLETKNRYELIMIAAKEARRLNDYYRIRNVEPKSRVTTEAMKRVHDPGARYAYGTPPRPEAEAEGAELDASPAEDG